MIKWQIIHSNNDPKQNVYYASLFYVRFVVSYTKGHGWNVVVTPDFSLYKGLPIHCQDGIETLRDCKIFIREYMKNAASFVNEKYKLDYSRSLVESKYAERT